MVSTATTVTPASTPNTNTTIIGAGAGPSTGTPGGAGGGGGGQHYISQGGGQTQTYHIFLPTSQGHQVSQYFPGGLLQTAMPGYHVAGPGGPYFTNFINPMLPAANSEFFQANVKSSSRGGGGGHNNYKTRGGRGGRGGAGGNSERNTPGGATSTGSHSTPQQTYPPQGYQAGYNPAHTGPAQPFPGYPAAAGQPQWNKNNGNRNPPGHTNNWETSSQHSNSSQKKFSSSSGSSETSLSMTSTVTPRLVQQQLAGGYPAQFRHEAPYYHQPRASLENIQSKEFVPTKRGRGGRGGSSRGREGAEMTGYNSNPRPGGQAGLPPQRNATHVYHQPRQHNNVIPGRSRLGIINNSQSLLEVI